MTAQENRRVSLILERRESDHPWQNHEWAAVGLTGDIGSGDGWTLLYEAAGVKRYLSPPSDLALYGTDTEAYAYNLASPRPSVFVVMREDEDAGGDAVGYTVDLVTVSAYEAQDYMDSSEERVERLALEGELHDWVAAFVDTHHVEQAFRKRRRDKVKTEEYKFGQEPLVELRKRGGPEDGGEIR